MTPAPSSPLPEAGPLRILEARPFPNPNPQSVRVRLAAPAERVVLRLYSPAMVLLAQWEHGPAPQGWSSLDLPLDLLERLPSGLCYAVLEARADGRRSPPLAPLRLWTLR